MKTEDVVFLVWKEAVTVQVQSQSGTSTPAELVGICATKQKADKVIFRAYEADAKRSGQDFYEYRIDRRVVH